MPALGRLFDIGDVDDDFDKQQEAEANTECHEAGAARGFMCAFVGFGESGDADQHGEDGGDESADEDICEGMVKHVGKRRRVGN